MWCAINNVKFVQRGKRELRFFRLHSGWWGPRGLSSTSRTARGPKLVALASMRSGLGLEHDVLEPIPTLATLGLINRICETSFCDVNVNVDAYFSSNINANVWQCLPLLTAFHDTSNATFVPPLLTKTQSSALGGYHRLLWLIDVALVGMCFGYYGTVCT